MKTLNNKRVLLFTSQLFDYHNLIKQAIEEQGAVVHMYDERNDPTSIEKIILRKAKFLLEGKYYHYFKKIANDEQSFNPDYVLFVSPEAIMPRSLKYLKQVFPQSTFILYMWDSVRNKHLTTVLSYFDKRFSFDTSDCEKFDMIFRPLFFAKDLKIETKKENYKYDFCFIGTVHSDRAKILHELKEICDENDLTYYFYLFVPGTLLLHLRKIFNRSLRLWENKYIHITPLPLNKVSEIESQSRCIVDINHPQQTGLTMRTIEMVGMKKKILTTNNNIKSYDFYRPEDQIIINRNHVTINKEMLIAKYVGIPKDIYSSYSIESWVKDIFTLNEVKK